MSLIMPAQFSYRVKGADTSRINNILTDDPDLQFPVEKDSVYLAEFYFVFNNIVDAGVDLSFTFNEPATSLGSVFGQATGSGMIDQTIIGSATHTFNLDLISTVNFKFNGVMLKLYLRTTADAGTCALQWAQQNLNPSAATTIYKGAFVRWRRIGAT